MKMRLALLQEVPAITPQRLIRVEMVKRGLKYADLQKRLRLLGNAIELRNLRNKVARGNFSAGFSSNA